MLFSLLLLIGCSSNDPVDDFEENRPGSVRAFYAYPSTIRMLGKIMGSESNEALSDIEKARLFIEWKSKDVDSRDTFISLKERSERSGFDELFSISSKNSDISVLLKEESSPRYIVFSFSPDVDYILELEGKISMSALREIGTLDMDNVVDVINLGKPSEKENAENSEKQ